MKKKRKRRARVSSRQVLQAPPTQIKRTIVEREIDRLWLRVQLRCAQLGITQRELARRLKVTPARLCMQLSEQVMTAAWFERLTAALASPGRPGDGWWLRAELPEHEAVSAEKVLSAVRRKLR